MTEAPTATQPDASAMKGVIPYIGYGGHANEAADFYAKAFGATDFGRMLSPDNPTRLMHAQLGINGGSLMLFSDNHLGRCRQPPWPVGLNGRRACPSGGQPHRSD